MRERPAEVDAELLHLREMVCITLLPVICSRCPPACARPEWVRTVVNTFSHAGSCSPDSAKLKACRSLQVVSLDAQLAEAEFVLAEATAARLSERCVPLGGPRLAWLQCFTAALDQQAGIEAVRF